MGADIRRRINIFLVAILGLPVFGQVGQNLPDPRVSIINVQQYFQEKNWAAVALTVQSALDIPDTVINISDKKLNSHDEANQILRELPKEGKDYYQQRSEPKAKELFDKTIQNPGSRVEYLNSLKNIYERFSGTPSGLKAGEQLALFYLDRGRFDIASFYLDSLLSNPELSDRSRVLQQALIAQTAVGNDKRKGEVLKELEQRNPHFRSEEIEKRYKDRFKGKVSEDNVWELLTRLSKTGEKGGQAIEELKKIGYANLTKFAENAPVQFQEAARNLVEDALKLAFAVSKSSCVESNNPLVAMSFTEDGNKIIVLNGFNLLQIYSLDRGSSKGSQIKEISSAQRKEGERAPVPPPDLVASHYSDKNAVSWYYSSKNSDEKIEFFLKGKQSPFLILDVGNGNAQNIERIVFSPDKKRVAVAFDASYNLPYSLCVFDIEEAMALNENHSYPELVLWRRPERSAADFETQPRQQNNHK